MAISSLYDEETRMYNIYGENLSNRAIEFLEFATAVLRHIEHYTVPQYGDAPSDQMSTATEQDAKFSIQRYLNRMGQNSRGAGEQARDLLKIAHYAAIIWGMRGLNSINPVIYQGVNELEPLTMEDAHARS